MTYCYSLTFCLLSSRPFNWKKNKQRVNDTIKFQFSLFTYNIEKKNLTLFTFHFPVQCCAFRFQLFKNQSLSAFYCSLFNYFRVLVHTQTFYWPEAEKLNFCVNKCECEFIVTTAATCCTSIATLIVFQLSRKFFDLDTIVFTRTFNSLKTKDLRYLRSPC